MRAPMVETKVARWWRARSGAAERARRPVAQQAELAVGGLEVAEPEPSEAPEGALRLVELVDQEGELGLGLAPALLLGAVEERGERAAHDRAVARAGRLELGRRLGAAKAEPARQREERVQVARHALRAPLLDDLQLVLDVAQEAVGGGERRGERRLDVARGGERGEGAERAPHLQTRVLAAVHELLRLHEELDLADAAPAELHVARRLGSAQRGVHPSLHRLQVLERPEVEVAAVDEGHELGDEPLAERAVPAHRTGLQPRGALPRLPPGLVVRERRRERDGDRPLAAARAEPEIDAEDEAVARDLAERARHLLGEAREELPERAARGLLAVALVDVDQIDVGTVVELLAAELAHTENDEGGGTALARHQGLAPLRGEAGAHARHRGVEHAFGERGQLAHRVLHAGEAEEVAAPDAHQLPPPVAAQRRLEVGARERSRRAGRGERRALRVRSPRGHLVHGGDERRPCGALGHQGARERRAAAEQPEQRSDASGRRRGLRRRQEPRQLIERRPGIRGRGEPLRHLVRGRAREPVRDRARRLRDPRRVPHPARGDRPRELVGGHGQSSRKSAGRPSRARAARR